MMTNSSAEASGRRALRAMPGASPMIRDFIAGEAAGHFAVRAAAQHDGDVRRAGDGHGARGIPRRWRARRRARPTTPAMPTAAVRAAPLRSGMRAQVEER